MYPVVVAVAQQCAVGRIGIRVNAVDDVPYAVVALSEDGDGAVEAVDVGHGVQVDAVLSPSSEPCEHAVGRESGLRLAVVVAHANGIGDACGLEYSEQPLPAFTGIAAGDDVAGEDKEVGLLLVCHGLDKHGVEYGVGSLVTPVDVGQLCDAEFSVVEAQVEAFFRGFLLAAGTEGCSAT